MKKFIALLTVLMLCATMFLPVMAAEAEFTPSVTNKPAPQIVPVLDPDGKSAIGTVTDAEGKIISYVYADCLVVTSVSEANTSTEIPDAAKALLLDVYDKLTKGEMVLPYEKHDSALSTSNMVIRDLFDVTFLCGEHPEMLEPKGVVFNATFKLGVAADAEVYTMNYKNNEWNPIVKTKNNGDGTVTCTFEDLCPVEFSVKTKVAPPVETGDEGNMLLWAVVAVVAICGIAVLSVIYFKDSKKAV